MLSSDERVLFVKLTGTMSLIESSEAGFVQFLESMASGEGIGESKAQGETGVEADDSKGDSSGTGDKEDEDSGSGGES